MSELAVVCGAGGFIGGHLVRSLLDQGYRVRAVDVKAHPKEWWQVHEAAQNKFAMDLRTFDACLKSLDGATRVYNLACFDERTEILTVDGWIPIKSVGTERLVATLSKEGVLEWQKPSAFCSYMYEGDMYHFRSKSVDICVTPNHKMYVKRPNKKEYELRDASACDLVQLRFKRFCTWSGTDAKSYRVAEYHQDHHNTQELTTVPIVPFLRFLGYYLSEGSCCIKKNGTYRVHLANQNAKIIDGMEKAVKDIGFTPYRDTSTSHGISFCSKEMCRYLERFGKAGDKFVPRDILCLSSDLLRHLFETLMEGDGSKGKNCYTTTSRQLADDFGEICMKLGYCHTIGKRARAEKQWADTYQIHFGNARDTLSTRRPTKVPYSGMVHCVEVPNHVIFVRRNGKTAWCGNCDMGGMGFIENNKALCMLSVLINTHLLLATRYIPVQRFFYSSSACVYAADKQKSFDVEGLKEDDAYPAMPEDGYGWEKLFSERMCRHFREDFGLQTRVARFHNVYGIHGSFTGGREKAPAAICRKVAEAKLSGKHEIEIWGDGNQVRSFQWIDDCIHGINLLMDSDIVDPLNIGSSEKVTINQLVDLTEEIAGVKLERRYKLDAPKGVNGRNSDNTKIKALLNWEPSTPLRVGLEKTYAWVEEQVKASR